MRRTSLSALALALPGALALGACQGVLLDGPAGPSGTTRSGPTACGTATTAASAMTRLTRTEYDYAIADLLGDTTAPARTFAPDDVTTGFEVGGAVSPLLAEQYLDTATTIAEGATADLPTLTGCDASLSDEACASRFVERFGRLAFRRSLTADESGSLMDLYREGVSLADHRTGIQLVLEAILVSPNFLYHVENGGTDASAGAGSTIALSGLERASRLSFFLWRSLPDEELLDAAEAGELEDPASLEMQARRMLEDERATRGIQDFYRQWLALDRLDTVEKDSTIYPEFDRDLASDMRASMEMYVADVMSHGATIDELFHGDFAYVNERLAPIFGLDGITGTELRRVSIDPTERGGLLTQPGLLTILGKANQSDPIHRGVFVRQRLLCQQLPPPPAGVDTTPPALEPGLTTRERFAEHRTEPTCAGCHQLIDPIGFGFEHFDALGRFRATEEGHDVDATGEIVSGGDATGTFDGVNELSDRLAQSDAVRSCVARQFFRFAAGRVETTDDQCALDRVQTQFESSGYDMRELMVAIATSDALTHRTIPDDPTSSGSTSPSP